MPNAPKTPTKTFRCRPELWEAAKIKVAQEGRTVTEVLISALEDYVGEV